MCPLGGIVRNGIRCGLTFWDFPIPKRSRALTEDVDDDGALLGGLDLDEEGAGVVVVSVDEGGAAVVVVDEGAEPLLVVHVVLGLLDLLDDEGARGAELLVLHQRAGLELLALDARGQFLALAGASLQKAECNIRLMFTSYFER